MDMDARDLITGERLQSLGDITIITEGVYQFHQSLGTMKTKLMGFGGSNQAPVAWEDLPEDAQRAQVFFVYTHLLDDFFRAIYPALRQAIVLITHNSDHGITEQYRSYLDDPKIVGWYAQNVLIEHPKLRAIPIGIANAQWPHGHLDTVKSVMDQGIEKTKDVYMNFDASTNLAGRAKVQEILKDKPFITHGEKRNFEGYLQDMAAHRFCVSPPGNGADCHRLWECLYLGVIPIVEKDVSNEQFKNLPIVRIERWEDLDEAFLEKQLARIESTDYAMDEISLGFWRRTIGKSRQEAMSTVLSD